MLKIHSLYENPMYNSHTATAKINFIITCKHEKGLKRIGDDEIDYILYVLYYFLQYFCYMSESQDETCRSIP